MKIKRPKAIIARLYPYGKDENGNNIYIFEIYRRKSTIKKTCLGDNVDKHRTKCVYIAIQIDTYKELYEIKDNE